jgi:hypothetical protein
MFGSLLAQVKIASRVAIRICNHASLTRQTLIPFMVRIIQGFEQIAITGSAVSGKNRSTGLNDNQ